MGRGLTRHVLCCTSEVYLPPLIRIQLCDYSEHLLLTTSRIRGPACRLSPLSVHTGALVTGMETSHSKQASSGAATSTSCSSRTISRDWAGRTWKRSVELFGGARIISNLDTVSSLVF
ncbi:hypothetical protein AALO_G00045930 [Alosa alosa]|uniref:Uncharacterized protein n=1 Tax=Alosa alosa TaxID=278164 RepID=A0AAV6H989_9TELE|nr:hypothetical protein AALO_G00045930 [Alosa alosa]